MGTKGIFWLTAAIGLCGVVMGDMLTITVMTGVFLITTYIKELFKETFTCQCKVEEEEKEGVNE